MSEAENQSISILLPPSAVAVYSKDQETLQAARDVAQDWRFARVDIMAEEGDIATAISTYKSMKSPDLVIIQTDDIGESLTAQLEELAGNCDASTAAIVIGPVNDVYLYRKLIDMGVSDYLVKPVPAADMADVLAKTLVERLGVTGSRLIAFAGAKGGVGVTSLAEAAAWGVSDMLGQKTILLDAAGGWSSLAVGMGFEPSTTLAEAARAADNNDEDSLNRMLFKASERLNVLASGGDVMLEQAITAPQMEKLIDMLMVRYPVVIVDLSNAAPDLRKVVITRANQIMVVTTPTLTSLRLARALAHEIKQMRGDDDHGIEIMINMQGIDSANEVPKKDIEKAIDMKISAAIGFDSRTFLRAESESIKMTDDKAGVQIVQNILLPVLGKVIPGSGGEQVAVSGKKGGGLSGFLGKLGLKS
jgi:pilus assembly protein CpaE